jgi:hypothetical protein
MLHPASISNAQVCSPFWNVRTEEMSKRLWLCTGTASDFFFAKTGTKLVVFGKDQSEDATRELADDLLAITTVFVARHNGQRSAANKRRKREDAQKGENIQAAEGEAGSSESVQNPGVSKQSAGGCAEEMDVHRQVDVQPMCRSSEEQAGEGVEERPTSGVLKPRGSRGRKRRAMGDGDAL